MALLNDLSMLELGKRLASREVSSVEATTACLSRIAAVDSKVKAFLVVDAEGALAAARQSDARRAAGAPASPLDGVPIAVKDLFCTPHLPTTAGSKMLEGFISPYEATVVARLREAGLPLLGKLNLDEFAMGSSTENSAFFSTRNPYDLERSPGGSSGGSAAAVAAFEAFGALGTDTGGSIRQPAAMTNVVGLKPTWGRVSRHGVVAFASSLDQVGPLARTVGDAAALLQVIAGADPNDSTCARVPVPDFSSQLEEGVQGLKLGVPREYFQAGLEPDVEAAVQSAIATYQRLGAKIIEVSLPHTRYALATYYLLASAEASSNLGRYDGVRYGHRSKDSSSLRTMYEKSRSEGFGAEVKRRILLGTFALASGYYDAYYLKSEGPDVDLPGLRAGVRPGRRVDLGHVTGHSLQARREIRAAADVPDGRPDPARVTGRTARNLSALRLHPGSTAGRPSAARQAVRRSPGVADRPSLRARAASARSPDQRLNPRGHRRRL